MSSSRVPISVVVPLYNKRASVSRCVRSVLAQTFAEFELIVVDDGSTDGGAEVVRAFEDPRVRLISQENRGVSAARNRGIAEAEAPLIAFLDADDAWEPEFLEAITHLVREYPDAGIYATGKRNSLGRHGYVDSTPILPGNARTGLVHDYLAVLREGALVSPSNVAIPRRVLDEVGLFPEGVAIGEDRDLWVRITLRYPIACDRRVLAVYSIVSGQSTCSRAGSLPPYPAAIGTLRGLIDSGTLSEGQRRRARDLADWFALDHLYNLVESGDSGALRRRLREERFTTARFGMEARLLGLAARCVPLRLIALLKHKHKWLPTPLDRRRCYTGKVMLHRRAMNCNRRTSAADAQTSCLE